MQDSGDTMSAWRSLGWWLGAAFGMALAIWTEWNWTGGFLAQVFAFLFALFLTLGYAALGCYITGFIEDTAEEKREERANAR